MLPRVRKRIGDVPAALIGWSMGGYGALAAAIGVDPHDAGHVLLPPFHGFD